MTPHAQLALLLGFLVVMFAGITWRHIEAVREYERERR